MATEELQSNGQNEQSFERKVHCPRCNQPYAETEWNGECMQCGYPEIFYDTIFTYGL